MTDAPIDTNGGSAIQGDVQVEDGDFVGRDKIVIHLTVPGTGPADLAALAEAILSALRSEAPVAIAAGPDDTTVLTVDGQPAIVTSREQGAALAGRAASSDEPSRVEAYLASLVIHRDFGPWDTCYVPLEASAPRPVVPQDWATAIPLELCALHRREGPEQRFERETLPDAAAAVERYRQFVLLGEPGAGKTTVLQKIALDAARARLQDPAAPVPLFVRLGEHRGTESPLDFLATRWRARVGTGLDSALRAGGVFLLLDALNEMPRDGYAERVADWRAFARQWENARLVFTCRTLDYAPTLPLQQVEITALDDDRIRDFLGRYVPGEAEQLWEDLTRQKGNLLGLARNPFLLKILAWTHAQRRATEPAPPEKEPALPPNRGQLMAELAAHLLLREESRAHPGWIDAGAQTEALSALAWTIQQQGEGTSLPTGEALRAIPAQVTVRGRAVVTDPETILHLGCAANLLEEDRDSGLVRFYHHLMQEYLAACQLFRRVEAGEDVRALWKAPWLARQMPAAEGRGEWDPLPPPPSTGWEETTVAAAGLARDPTAFVETVRQTNPLLAGRCLDEGAAAASDDLRRQVQADLLAGIQDRRVHLRARIAAGHVLGRIGDPRFAAHEHDGARFIPPPLVHVPAGSYAIGSGRRDRRAYANERPRHRLRLDGFWIGRYPVTVAEYRCFVEAGGYDAANADRYWHTEAARAWLRGEETEGGVMEEWMEIRQGLLDSGRPVEHWAKEWSRTPQWVETWTTLISLSEEEARALLRPILADRSRQEPQWWGDPAYNGANQPVVGVTWYEARAYCAWLTEKLRNAKGDLQIWCEGNLQTLNLKPENLRVRLPTEAEWEAAVRGPASLLGALRGGTIYPWGRRFDARRANTVEGRVLGTTPVGVYPQGVSPLGLWDGAGNVWEWTQSLYKGYPYHPEDGRNDPEAEGRRVVRGGSWDLDQRFARCAFRSWDLPDVFFGNNLGFRLVVSPERPRA